MLLKFFSSKNNSIPQNHNPNPNHNTNFTERPLIVQIIHAGGTVERYYMAFPAAFIIDKYPKSVLTRPDVFHHPWDSIVPPEEILIPGKKYFVVPVETVKKLRRRMRKSTAFEVSDSGKPVKAKQAANRRVRFKGVESKMRYDAEDKGKKNDDKKKSSSNGKGLRKKKIVRFSPSLTVIKD